MKRYIDALNHGKELVIVANETGCYSSIFWKTDGKYFCFSRAMGVIQHNYMDDSAMLEHINMLLDEDAMLFIRG